MGYLSEESLKKLVNDPGKYSMDDSSVLSHHLNKWWTCCASYVPTWISANTVTVGAAFPLIFCWILSIFYSFKPGSDGLPCWLMLFASFSEFFFQTMDAVDGKHARRLGTSSSLGDFLDHVMDSVSIMTTSFLVCHGFGFQSRWFEFMCLIITSLNFVVVHWESAKILVMKLDNGCSITEAQIVFMIIFFITSIGGKEFWQITPIPVIPFITLGRAVAAILIGVISVVQCIKSLSRVAAKCDLKAILPELLVPVVGSTLVAISWLIILPEGQSVAPFQMVLLSSTVIHACCITLNRLTLQPIVPKTTLVVIIPAFLPLIVPAAFRVTVSWIVGIWAIIYLLYFLSDVVLTIAHALHIPVFAQPELKKAD